MTITNLWNILKGIYDFFESGIEILKSIFADMRTYIDYASDAQDITEQVTDFIFPNSMVLGLGILFTIIIICRILNRA